MKLIENGRDPPDAYYTQPRIEDCNVFHWEAFHDLSTERQIGMGLGPIPRSSIMDYARESELFGDAAEQFAAIIRAVDTEYLRMANSGVSKDTKKKQHTEIPVTDTVGIKQLLMGLGARAKAKKGQSN